VVYVTVSQSIVLGAHHQGAVACFRHDDEHCFRCDDSSLKARKPYAGCGGPRLLTRAQFESRMYCLSADPSCFGRCFRTSLKPFERTGS
jgi:hypothetical protein